MEPTLNELKECVMAARATRRPLTIRGGGTKNFYGESPPVADAETAILNLSAHKGIVNYQPSELVITARAGTLLTDVEQILAEQQQMLAFEPPRLGSASTLGGCVASGLSGPRRMAAGSLRDFILGAQLLDSGGTILNFGGEVMKNVAGYDVSRLLAGSLGILGPILEMSIKVAPKPACEATLVLDMSEAQALSMLSQWRGLPLPISATAWTLDAQGSGVLRVRLSGSVAAIRQGRAHIGGQEADAAAAHDFWTGLRDQTHTFFRHRPLWRIAVPPTVGPLGLGSTLVEWNGGQRWLADLTISPAELRRQVAALGGHATLYRYENKLANLPVFHPLHAGLNTINRRLKQEFDPTGIFNPGRLFPDF